MDEEGRPIPIGVDKDGNVRAYPYRNNSTFTGPRYADNALWFRTTTNSSSPSLNPTYVADKPLFYLGYQEGNNNNRNNGGNKPILPPTAEINDLSLIDDSSDNDPYRYTFCIADTAGVQSKDYYGINKSKDKTVTPGSGCPDVAREKIQQFRQYLMQLDAKLDNNTGNVIEDTNNDGIVVYEIEDGNITAGTTYTLTGDSNGIFVLRTPASTAMTFKGSDEESVQLDLASGVNPNNIFWVSDAGMTFEDAPDTKPHILAGNFIGKYDGTTSYKLQLGENTKIIGGRFLGFKGGTGSSGLGNIDNVPNGVDIRAITSQANPSLVPVLQIHEPDAQAGAANLNGGDASNDTGWMVEAQDTTFNLVVGSGDTPAREGQGNGGLQNLVRFLENWKKPTAKVTNISGSFIQLERSKYATAPQQQIIRADEENDRKSELFDYFLRYESGSAGGILGFQTAPTRNWGFDVGLLSQPPDLFALKFTLPPSEDPDEYFREVGIDDPWIKGLLCSETTNSVNTDHRPKGIDCTDYDKS